MERIRTEHFGQSGEILRLKERCQELFDSCEGIEFRFPGVHPYADARNKAEEAALTPAEQELIDMAGEPTYAQLVESLASDKVVVVVQGGSYFVASRANTDHILAVSALNIEAYMDESLAELITTSRKLQRLKRQ